MCRLDLLVTDLSSSAARKAPTPPTLVFISIIIISICFLFIYFEVFYFSSSRWRRDQDKQNTPEAQQKEVLVMRLRHCESGEAVELVEGEVTYLGRGVLGVTDKRISRRQLQISLRGPALAVTVYATTRSSPPPSSLSLLLLTLFGRAMIGKG
jgi:hypothetical protein